MYVCSVADVTMSTDDILRIANAQMLIDTCAKGESFAAAGDLAYRSKPFTLHRGKKYYIDIVHKVGKGFDHLQVAWSQDGGTFHLLQTPHISAYEDTSVRHILSRDSQTSEWEIEQVFQDEEQGEDRNLPQFVVPKYFPDAEIKDALPACRWDPADVHPRKVSRYEAASKAICRWRYVHPEHV